MPHAEIDQAIHLALTRVHATREALALKHGEAEARLTAYELELAGEAVTWQGDGERFLVGSHRAHG